MWKDWAVETSETETEKVAPVTNQKQVCIRRSSIYCLTTQFKQFLPIPIPISLILLWKVGEWESWRKVSSLFEWLNDTFVHLEGFRGRKKQNQWSWSGGSWFIKSGFTCEFCWRKLRDELFWNCSFTFTTFSLSLSLSILFSLSRVNSMPVRRVKGMQ